VRARVCVDEPCVMSTVSNASWRNRSRRCTFASEADATPPDQTSIHRTASREENVSAAILTAHPRTSKAPRASLPLVPRRSLARSLQHSPEPALEPQSLLILASSSSERAQQKRGTRLRPAERSTVE
jgi:hypothetical protein